MRRPLALLALPAAGLLLSACGSTVATSRFKGAQHEVAQTISNLQSDVVAGDQKKVCGSDLSAAVVQRLGGKKACESAVNTQLSEIDNTELAVETVTVAGSGTSAKVALRSIYEGKTRKSAVNLVKEAGKWKIASLT
jgi:hypothetical protein